MPETPTRAVAAREAPGPRGSPGTDAAARHPGLLVVPHNTPERPGRYTGVRPAPPCLSRPCHSLETSKSVTGPGPARHRQRPEPQREIRPGWPGADSAQNPGRSTGCLWLLPLPGRGRACRRSEPPAARRLPALVSDASESVCVPRPPARLTAMHLQSPTAGPTPAGSGLGVGHWG